MTDRSIDAIRRAKAESERARRRMDESLTAAKDALKPQTIANNAWESVRDIGGGIAGEVVDTVKSKPITASSIGAAVTVALARRPLRWLSDKLSKPRDEHATEADARTFTVTNEHAPEVLEPAAGRVRNEGVNA